MAAQNQCQVPLAIIGIGCRFPGNATSPKKFWELLVSGSNVWSPVPADRWNERAFHHPNADDKNGTHNHSGGHFLKQDIAIFDAGFFNILVEEASGMDPQQRLLLETTYEALESAGIPQESIRGSNTSVHMGMFTRDYDRNIYKDTMSIPKYHATGTGEAILANRISHLFGLHGPSMTIDTGCSGGMTAVHQACQSLRYGETDMALAGAANLILSPDHMISMSNLHMLNKDGKSYSFDAMGNGYGRGEGVATLVIKRLDDAIRSRDPIRAIIRETAINQNGLNNGITLPSSAAQVALQRKAWKCINLEPKLVSYVEAHGTGTIAGDEKELEAISNVFCSGRDIPLFVGSVKSIIGHLESASGLAALIKATLMLEYGLIPPNANFRNPKPTLNLDQKKIKIPVLSQPLNTSSQSIIPVNSFGYGGSNGHVILESAQEFMLNDVFAGNINQNNSDQIPRLFLLSAKNLNSLAGVVSRLRDWTAEQQNGLFLSDLSYTLGQRRSIFPYRFTCVASSQQELLKGLGRGTRSETATRISPSIKINFVFTGQGAQWPRMGCELLGISPFRASMYKSRDILYELGVSWDLIQELMREGSESRLQVAELSQPVTTTVQIALVDLFRSLGVNPEAVVGHSSGEIAAAYCAGYISHSSALRISYYRGFASAISERRGNPRGAMLAVAMGEADMSGYLSKLKTGIVLVACQNSPYSTTVSGDEVAILELSEILSKNKIFNRKLNVDTAYHSHHMHAAAGEYQVSLGNVEMVSSPKDVKLFSSVTGEQRSQSFDSNYWVSNLVSKVRFCDAIQELCRVQQESARHTQSRQIFVEIGPHSVLDGPIRQCIADLIEPMPYEYNSALVRNTGALGSLLITVGKLFDRGCNIDLAAVSALNPTYKTAKVLYDLPTYSWDHSKRYWHESRISRNYRLRNHPYHDLLGTRMVESTTLEPRWRHMIGATGLPWLVDHLVDGLIIFPGAGYICMAIEAARQLAMDQGTEDRIDHVVLKEVSFLKGLVIPKAPARVEVQLSFGLVQNNGDDNHQPNQYRFSVAALSQDEVWHEHCRGLVTLNFKPPKSKGSVQAFENMRIDSFRHSSNFDIEVIEKQKIYEELGRSGNTYGPTFTGINQLSMDDSHAVCNMTIPDVASVMPSTYFCPHMIHPTTLDTIMHSSLPVVMKNLGPGSVMPVYVDEVFVSASIDNQAGRSLFASTTLNLSRFRVAEADIIVHSSNKGDELYPVLFISGVELRSFAISASENLANMNPRELCYELKWGLDADFLNAKDLLPHSAWASPEHKHNIMNHATKIYISHCLKTTQSEALGVPEARHSLLLKWMDGYLSHERGMAHSSESELEVLKLASQQGVEGELLSRLGTALSDIVTEKVDAMQIMLEDDLLYRIYGGDSSARCYALMCQYVKHLCFKQANISVLEIGGGTGGATLPFLQAMEAEGTRPVCYDFTDVSTGFFDRAQRKLQQWTESMNMNFKILDIDRDPVEQGFQEASYDVIIASNVLHATPRIDETLARVHKLLKNPNGTLILIEVTTPQPWMNITFGTLPGWWKGATEGREEGPFLSATAWEKALSSSSFALQLITYDDAKFPVSSLIVGKTIGHTLDSTTVDKNNKTARLIVSGAVSLVPTELRVALTKRLEIDGYKTDTVTWNDKELLGNDDAGLHIVLDSGSCPVFISTKPETFLTITSLVRKPSAKILWISLSDMHGRDFQSKKHLITGFSRTAHTENQDLQLVTIDIQGGTIGDGSDLVESILQILRRTVGNNSSTTEREYIIRSSSILVPRVIPSETLNKWISKNIESNVTEMRKFKSIERPLILEMEKKNCVDYPTFVKDEAYQRPLGETEVEIDVRAIGIPFSGVQSTMYEYGGVALAIGDQVSHIKIGDRVLAISSVPCASQPRVSSTLVQLIPDAISFTMAASIPVSFMTACYALIDRADLQFGQKILIDGASNHIGQAAIMLARQLGVVVIAAVADQKEQEKLEGIDRLPADHIIPRGGYQCKQALRKLLGSDRLNAVFNFLDSQLSTEIAGFIEPFGIVINAYAYARPSVARSFLKIPSNIQFLSFDLQSLLHSKPHYGPELLQKALNIISTGIPIGSNNITVREIQDLRDCFQLSKGSLESTDKSVLYIDENSQVQVSVSSRSTLKLKVDATYIVAGGLGDLGKRFLHLMAKAGAQYLVTLSRRGADPAEFSILQEELSKLRAGCKLYSLKCNIADESSVHAAEEAINSMNLPPIKGVVQAAVILQDSTLDSMTVDVFNNPLKSKLYGTLNLQKFFDQGNLEFFISLSSAAGILGTGGQANYNAGNTVQDALAQFQQSSKCHYISLDIGTIDGADITVGNQTRIQALHRQGFTPITPDELLAFFEYAMSPESRDAGCHQLIIGFDSQSVIQTTATNGTVHSPMFTHVRKVSKANIKADTGPQKKTFKNFLSESQNLESILEFIATSIGNKLCSLTAIDTADFDLSRSIHEFGLDSLIAIELRNWVMREFDAPLQSSEILDDQRLLDLARKVSSRSRLMKDLTEMGSNGDIMGHYTYTSI